MSSWRSPITARGLKKKRRRIKAEWGWATYGKGRRRWALNGQSRRNPMKGRGSGSVCLWLNPFNWNQGELHDLSQTTSLGRLIYYRCDVVVERYEHHRVCGETQ